MPYKSIAQLRFMHAVHPGIARRWDKKYKHGKLPKKVRHRYSGKIGEAFMGHAGRPGRRGGSLPKLAGHIVSGFKNIVSRLGFSRSRPNSQVTRARVGAPKYRLPPAAYRRTQLRTGGGTGSRLRSPRATRQTSAMRLRSRPVTAKRTTTPAKRPVEWSQITGRFQVKGSPASGYTHSKLSRPKTGMTYDPKTNILLLGKNNRPSPAVVKILLAKGIKLPDRPKTRTRTPRARRAA